MLVERQALCPWTSHSATEQAREEHSCELIFICIAASWGHEMRPRERQWRTDYKGRVRRNDKGRERERAATDRTSGTEIKKANFLLLAKPGH